MAQHRLASAQLKAIKEARQQVVDVVEANSPATHDPDVGPCRRGRRRDGDGDRLRGVLAVLQGPAGAGRLPRIKSEGRADGHALQQRRLEYGEGISKNGNPRVRRMLSQLAWRWLIYQPESALAQWYQARLGGAKGRMNKILIVALMRKLVIALWSLVETGEVPAGVRLAAAWKRARRGERGQR